MIKIFFSRFIRKTAVNFIYHVPSFNVKCTENLGGEDSQPHGPKFFFSRFYDLQDVQ